MSEKISAGGLWESLKGKFNLGPKKPGEASLAGVRAPAVAPSTEIPDWSKITGVQPVGWTTTEAPEPTPTMMPPGPAIETTELPDWLIPPDQTAETYKLPDRIKQVIAEAPTPTPAAAAPDVLKYLEEQETKLAVEKRPVPAPEPVAPLPVAEVPAVEAPAPMAAAEVKVEDDPFATNREFNGYMEIIRNAQAVLATGIELDYKDQKKALIAVAKSNSLLPKLPPEVFKSVLLMRAVASGNPKFGRDDFQREMLAAMDVIKGKK